MGVCQRVAHLAQEEHGPIGRNRTELPHEGFQVAAGQQFHHVVERTFTRHSEVEQLDGMGRAQRRRGLRFALEAPQEHPRLGVVARAEDLGPHELDGRLPGQELVPRPPDLAQLRFDAERRLERQHWALQHQRDLAAAQPAQVAAVQAHQFAAAKPDRSANPGAA